MKIMEEKLGRSLNHLQTLAIHIDEMEELINPNQKIKAAYDVLIKNIYRWHVQDALALQTYFKEVFLKRLIDMMGDIESLLIKYSRLIQLKYHWMYNVYNALIRTRAFLDSLRVVKNI